MVIFCSVIDVLLERERVVIFCSVVDVLLEDEWSSSAL